VEIVIHSALVTVSFLGVVSEDLIPMPSRMTSQHVYDVLPFGRLWYYDPDAVSNAIGYAKFFSRSRDAVIRVYD